MIFAASEGEDQPIDQDGLLSITGGAIIAAGSNSMSGVKAETTQIEKIYTGNINSGTQLEVIDSNGVKIIDETTPKSANYIYFNYKSTFTVELNDNEITLSEPENNFPNNNPPNRPGDMGGNRPGENNNKNYGSTYMFKFLNVFIIILVIL